MHATDPSPLPPVRLVAMLDAVERVALLALFSFFTWRVGAAALADLHPISMLILVSEGAVLVFVLLRRRGTALSLRPQDWILAFLGTVLPLLATPADVDPLAPPAVAGSLMTVGILVQIHAKLILRRRFGIVAANRGVVRGGPYRLVRHPMYLGYAITHVGFLLMVPTLWNLGVYAVALACQVGRILAEERLLTEDPEYRAFRAQVRYRLVPGLF